MFAAIGLMLLGGDGDTGGGAAAASPTIRPASEAVRQTAAQVTTALGRSSIQVVEPQTPYRPGESPSLFAAPRLVLQAVLPDDPGGGYMLVYDLRTPANAAQAGRDYADYLASGVGRVQFPRDARFVLRQVGSTLVFFAWSPDTSPDARTAEVATALESIGEGIAVPG
jgi:hypothetical protein